MNLLDVTDTLPEASTAPPFFNGVVVRLRAKVLESIVAVPSTSIAPPSPPLSLSVKTDRVTVALGPETRAAPPP